MWDRNAANLGRAERGKRIVWFDFAVTALGNGLHWAAGDARISVDGRGIEPIEADHAIVDPEVTTTMFAAFAIDAATSAVELGIPLDDSGELQRFPIDLGTSVLVDDPDRMR
jgi:hypothetical protein